jgi:hypothetical protein
MGTNGDSPDPKPEPKPDPPKVPDCPICHYPINRCTCGRGR